MTGVDLPAWLCRARSRLRHWHVCPGRGPRSKAARNSSMFVAGEVISDVMVRSPDHFGDEYDCLISLRARRIAAAAGGLRGQGLSIDRTAGLRFRGLFGGFRRPV